jgi:hypothetical protein
MFFLDPSGNALEFKAFQQDEAIFASWVALIFIRRLCLNYVVQQYIDTKSEFQQFRV